MDGILWINQFVILQVFIFTQKKPIIGKQYILYIFQIKHNQEIVNIRKYEMKLA